MLNRRIHSTVHALGSLLLVITSLLIPFNPIAQAESASPQDTPTPVVSYNSLEEWSVGNGLIYWSDSCFADEFNPFANLFRKPVGGGTERTIQAINDFARCITFLDQLSASDGLYYFDSSQHRISRMSLSQPYTDHEVKTVTSDQEPRNDLREANGYLYWIGFQTILRTLKDGSGDIETVANTNTSPSDLLVLGNLVYWIDSGGLKTISISCASLPCSDNTSTLVTFSGATRGYGLTYQPPTGGGIINSTYRVYWVQYNSTGTPTYKIRYCSLNNILASPCEDPVIQPLSAASTDAPETAPADFYVASPNWFIGRPLFANGNLYWTERDISTVNNDTGDLKRKARTAALNDPADTIATNQAKIDNNLYATSDTIFFARVNNGIYSLPLAASAITRNYEASAMEVTQAIQNLANSAPLVADKTTYVRAYGRQLDGPNTPNVEGYLVGTKNGSPLPGSPLRAVNLVRALNAGGSFDRARLNDGWYFQLPASWIQPGQVTFKFQVDPRHLHNDPNLANNELSQTVTFQNQPPVCVWTVPVRTHTPLPSVNDPNFWSMVDHFERRWPVPDTWIFRDTEPVEELQICTWYGIPYPCYGPYELEDGWGITNGPPDRDKVIASLWTRALLTFNPDACDDIGAPVHFMGMVHPDANNGGASGYASLISNQSWVQLPDHTPNPIPAGWNNVRPGRVMAQELAHNHGRKHIDCGNPDNTDGSYPYPPCQISNVGPDQYYGFDPATLTPIRPNQASDFMTYGNSQWVSDYTWRALINDFALSSAANRALAPAETNANAAGESVFVTGILDVENNEGQISTVLVLPAASLPPATRQMANVQAAQAEHEGEPLATYTLKLLDSNGTVLLTRTLTPILSDDHSPDGASALFSDLFAKPAAEVTTIQLLADNAVIDTVQPGAATPTVTIEQPSAGAEIDANLSIQWSAADADPADRLLFTVQYSHDNGAKWHTLTTNFPSTPEGHYTLTLADLGSLQGSAPNQALIRVLASDGYHTGIATSQPFTVKNRAPEPAILTPVNGQEFAAGEAVPLHGTATDAEDGGLSGSALAWSVDGVALGTGNDQIADGLAPGARTASLTATDSNNNVATASQTFNVAPLSVPLVSFVPLLDGSCDDTTYADGSVIQLKPYGDDSQANVRLLRTNDDLWACFSGLRKGAADPGSFAGLRVDVDHSASGLAQAGDFGFFAGEDGDVSTVAGDGVGGFAASGPGGLQAQVKADSASWSAELRIDQTVLGGWNHLVGLNVGHYSVDTQDDDYVWPYASAFNQPKSWATTVFGIQPLLTALDPFTATVGSSAFTLTVEGSDLISGTTILWASSELPTTWVDDEHLTATVEEAQLSSPGDVLVSLRSPEPANFESNKLTFVVEALAPQIESLSPASTTAGSPAITLVVNGNNFTADAQVLWNGTPLATQFVNSTQVKVQLSADLLRLGQSAGIAVRNQSPAEKVSSEAGFEVETLGKTVYLPLMVR